MRSLCAALAILSTSCASEVVSCPLFDGGGRQCLEFRNVSPVLVPALADRCAILGSALDHHGCTFEGFTGGCGVERGSHQELDLRYGFGLFCTDGRYPVQADGSVAFPIDAGHDAGVNAVDAGVVDSGTPDAGKPDAGTPVDAGIPFCSISGTRALTATFRNNLNRTVYVFWVDYTCVERENGSIPPGQSIGINTYVTHPFRVRAGPGSNLALITEHQMTLADVPAVTIEIGDAGVDAGVDAGLVDAGFDGGTDGG